MAQRRNTATADTPENEVVEKPEEKAAGGGGEETASQPDSLGEGSTGATSQIVKRVYIGPSIPFGKLRTSMILTGTEKEMEDFIADEVEKYPEIPYLLVPPEELAEAQEKVGKKGTILHKYYGDMLAKSRASRVGQG